MVKEHKILHDNAHMHRKCVERTWDAAPTLADAVGVCAANKAAIAASEAIAVQHAALIAARDAAREAEKAAKDAKTMAEIKAAEFMQMTLYSQFAPLAELALAARDLAAIEESLANWPAELWTHFKPEGQDWLLRSRLKQARDEIREAHKEADRSNWIAAHGSPHLRAATAAGYRCGDLYETERAAIEYVGGVRSIHSHISVSAVSCPSETALRKATELSAVRPNVKAEVVYVNEAPKTSRDQDVASWFAGEGIIVHDPAYVCPIVYMTRDL